MRAVVVAHFVPERVRVDFGVGESAGFPQRPHLLGAGTVSEGPPISMLSAGVPGNCTEANGVGLGVR
jgi:hypothetical protein